MRELALHILDLVENSLRADARTVAVSITADTGRDRLRIVILDDGCGLKVTPEQALDPFYTTKTGKRTGLGLSLFKEAAEQAGGCLRIERAADHTASGSGVRVVVEMGLRHVDRNPLGDLAGTLAPLVCTNPDVRFQFRLELDERTCVLDTAELARAEGVSSIALARIVRERLAEWLRTAAVLS